MGPEQLGEYGVLPFMEWERVGKKQIWEQEEEEGIKFGFRHIISEMPPRSPSEDVNRWSAVLREKTELEVKPDALFVGLIQCERGRCGRGLRIKPAKLTEKKQPRKRKSKRGWGPDSQRGARCRKEGVIRG